MTEDHVATAGAASGAVPVRQPDGRLADHWGLVLTYGADHGRPRGGARGVAGRDPEGVRRADRHPADHHRRVPDRPRRSRRAPSTAAPRVLVGLFGALALVVGLLCLR